MNNSTSAITSHFISQSWKFSEVMNTIIVPILAVVGLFGNILSAYILSRPNCSKSQLSIYLFILALWDTLLVVTAFGVYSLLQIFNNNLTQSLSPYLLYCVCICYPLCAIARVGSIWTLLCATMERFSAIYFPYRHHDFYRDWHCKFILGTVVVASVIFNIPKFFIISVANLTTKDDKTVYYIKMAKYSKNYIYIMMYKLCLHVGFVTFGPWLLQTVLTFLINRKISHLSQGPETVHLGATQTITSSTPRISSSTTKLLVMIGCKSLSCLILPTTLSLLEGIIRAGRFHKIRALDPVVDVANMLVVANSAVNFFVYLVYGQQFRAEVVQCLWYCFACVSKPVAVMKDKLSKVPVVGPNKLLRSDVEMSYQRVETDHELMSSNNQLINKTTTN